MDAEVKRWIEKDGIAFLKEMGIKKRQTILDFGCGEGHYTIPASVAVGKNGRVFALDKSQGVLDRLKETAGRYSLKNIELLNKESRIPVADNSVDIVLCYDIIHYEEKEQRKIIYSEVYRVLKKQSIFSVYPKHCKDDYPLDRLALVGMDDIIKEIEESGFILENKLFKNFCMMNI